MPTIALLICGAPGGGGLMPLYTIASPIPDLEDGKIGGLAQFGNYYIEITNTANYTQFTLVPLCLIKTTGGGRESNLKISIFIPKGYTLGNEATPLNLLLDIYHEFRRQNMDNSGISEANVWWFKEKDKMAPQDVFKKILDSYTLQTYLGPHRPMTGTTLGNVVIAEEQMELLCRDIQYTEFTQYKSIILSAGKSATLEEVRVAVPRPRNFSISVNGKPWKKISSDNFSEKLAFDLSEIEGKSKEGYVFEVYNFSVNDILTQNPANFVINYDNETISCTINCKEKEQPYIIDVVGCDDSNKDDILSNLTIRCNGRPAEIVKGSNILVLRGEQCSNPTFSISCQAVGYQLVSHNISNGHVEVVLKPTTTFHPALNPQKGGVTLNFSDYEFNNKHKKFSIAIKGSNGKPIYEGDKTFKFKEEDEKEWYTTTISQHDFSSSYKQGECKIESIIGDNPYYTLRNKGKIRKGDSEIELVCEKKSFLTIYWRGITFALVALVAITAIIYLIVAQDSSTNIDKEYKNRTNKTDQLAKDDQKHKVKYDEFVEEILSKKFKDWEAYFENLEIEFDNGADSVMQKATFDFIKEFADGVVIHQDLEDQEKSLQKLLGRLAPNRSEEPKIQLDTIIGPYFKYIYYGRESHKFANDGFSTQAIKYTVGLLNNTIRNKIDSSPDDIKYLLKATFEKLEDAENLTHYFEIYAARGTDKRFKQDIHKFWECLFDEKAQESKQANSGKGSSASNGGTKKDANPNTYSKKNKDDNPQNLNESEERDEMKHHDDFE